jgi:hypothetical protein
MCPAPKIGGIDKHGFDTPDDKPVTAWRRDDLDLREAKVQEL